VERDGEAKEGRGIVLECKEGRPCLCFCFCHSMFLRAVSPSPFGTVAFSCDSVTLRMSLASFPFECTLL